MSRGYSDYREMRELRNQPEWKPEPAAGDNSRLYLVAMIFLAFGVGFFFYFRVNDPATLVKTSVEKTLRSPFTASVEGMKLLDGSEIESYRSHETSEPGKAVSVKTPAGMAVAPYDSRQVLEFLRTISNAKEMKREDMYGHPARHISGEFPNPQAISGQPKSYHFDYWLDLMNRKAVRVVVRGTVPNAVVSVLGDSLTSEIFLNVRWKY